MVWFPTGLRALLLAVVSALAYKDGLDPKIMEALQENIKWTNIRDNLQQFTMYPHYPGTPNNYRMAEEIVHNWKNAGLENVHYIDYDALIPYPNYDRPNRMTVLSKTGAEIYKTTGRTPVVIPKEQGYPGADLDWAGFSTNGTVIGDVLFCNLGNSGDYEAIEAMGISLKGKICLVRYSNVNKKPLFPSNAGILGMIIYSDPKDVAREGTKPENVYPNTKYLPPDAAQHPTLRGNWYGDYPNPSFPAKKDLFNYETVESLRSRGEMANFPVLPISYGAAYEILSRMDGPQVPAAWQGGLNVTYRMGPTMKSGVQVKIEVHAKLETSTIRNFVGYIRGSEEPDKYVMLGNHYDAWVYGSVDPMSGTAVLAEVARSIVQTMKEQNWKPKRTLMFCGWDGEEQGMIGSVEFVEEFVNQLQDRTVVYLNVDNVHANGSLHVSTIPSLYRISTETAKLVANPMTREINAGRTNLYDSWNYYYPGNLSYYPEAPWMPHPFGNSDHAGFIDYAGLPFSHISYQGRDSYLFPLYHTLYETPFLNEHIFDMRNLSLHRAVGQYWSLMAYQFADLPELPLDIQMFAKALYEDFVPKLKNDIFRLLRKVPEANKAVKQAMLLMNDAEKLLRDTKRFEQIHFAASAHNDRVMGFHKCFINPRGVMGNISFRNVIFSNASQNSVFNLVRGLIKQLAEAKTTAEKEKLGHELAYQVSIIQYSLKCASATLADLI
ncbi:hypothetical protein L596_006081 [Steinernema carpocapsae]|uniref:Peptidase M28 domain-containing protein n=1 Tax=Steinernema carpocapsae TaxID=34508 RepID=A0A4U8V145_STECR|nr:hypothetical protein L596_006081 [Steinernema carpocapsae]